MPLKAVIFDVYNTLFNNDTANWIATFEDITQTQKLPVLAEELWVTWRTFESRFRLSRNAIDHQGQLPAFKTYQQAWQEAFGHAFEELGVDGDPDQAAEMSVDALAKRNPYHDTLQLLEFVKNRWKSAVLTNADNRSLFPLLRYNELEFDSILTSEIAKSYKPDGKIFNDILDNLDVLPDEAIYIGDTLLDDIHGARAAGIPAVWINRNGSDRDHSLLQPDKEIKSLNELAKILEQINEIKCHD
tara:strand:- start:597 stop:1328 length:732 start_codon:yes stop_codon:yes gene_type:complete